MFPVPVFDKSEFIHSKVQLIDFELLGSRIINSGASQSGAQSSTDGSVSGTQSATSNQPSAQQLSSAPRSQADTNLKTDEFQVGGDDTYEEKSDSLSIWSIVLKALAFLSLLIIIKAFVFKKVSSHNIITFKLLIF